jgi:hypothetical protein
MGSIMMAMFTGCLLVKMISGLPRTIGGFLHYYVRCWVYAFAIYFGSLYVRGLPLRPDMKEF